MQSKIFFKKLGSFFITKELLEDKKSSILFYKYFLTGLLIRVFCLPFFFQRDILSTYQRAAETVFKGVLGADFQQFLIHLIHSGYLFIIKPLIPNIDQLSSILLNKDTWISWIDFNNNIYVCRSKYYMQLEQYLNYFSKSNILITTLEDLYSHRLQTLQEVFRFLDVDDSFYNRKFFKIKHKSNYKRRKNLIGLAISQIPGINIVERLPFDIREKVKTLIYFPFSHKIERPVLENNLRQELIDYLRDDINCLREFTCYNFESWCV